jgi:5-methylcytosine-specific restriction endonuclease McrA
MPQTPEERRAKNAQTKRENYAKNRAQILAYNEAWRLQNLEAVLQQRRDTYDATKEAKQAEARQRRIDKRALINAQRRAKRIEDHDRKLAVQRTYNETHRDKLNAQTRARYDANPAQRMAYNATRRALKANAPINDFSDAQWQELLLVFDHRCAYCERQMAKLTQEHITPYEKGGSNTLWNIVPACQSCNSKKGVGPPLCPVQPLLLTMAPARTPRPRKVCAL